MFKVKTQFIKISKIMPLIACVFILISLILFQESVGYIKGFPLSSSENIQTLEEYKLLGKVFPRFERLKETEKTEVLNRFFEALIQEDTSLKENERLYIEKNFINKRDFKDYDQIWDGLYKLSIENGTIEKFEKIRINLSYFSGMDLEDGINRLEKVAENHRLAFDFAYEFADKIIILWSLATYLIVSYFFYIYRRKGSEAFLLTSPYSHMKYSLTNLLKIQGTVLLLSALQYTAFSLAIHYTIRGEYRSCFSDYLMVLIIFIVPASIFFVNLAYLLNEISRKQYLTAPMYYSICFLCITPVLEANKCQLVLPHIRRDMFEIMDANIKQMIGFNRITIMVINLILLVAIILLYKKKKGE